MSAIPAIFAHQMPESQLWTQRMHTMFAVQVHAQEGTLRENPLFQLMRVQYDAAGQHEQQAAQQPQAATEGAASEKEPPASQDNGSNGSAGQNGQGQGQGSDTNGAPTSMGLPIAPLRLDSGLQVC